MSRGIAPSPGTIPSSDKIPAMIIAFRKQYIAILKLISSDRKIISITHPKKHPYYYSDILPLFLPTGSS